MDDVHRFLQYFALSACKNSTPHIYISALPFWFKSGFVYKNYFPLTQGLITIQESSLDYYKKSLIVEWNTKFEIHSVAYSSDGNYIIYGGCNHIELKSVFSGNTLWSIKDDIRTILCIAISPNGKTIVSGSEDNMIRLWDALTGNPIEKPFIGHDDSVTSVAFSPDGTTILSGSEDETIRL